ncbi:ATP-binding cassette domain-containing protein [Actinoplanes sp. NPDC051346]|uniref:ATP-binding cassette domain-containing protein n=1 Tax=Actinoplanes sp. NPDC051346 TaxID=3155048 RepID=UPI0034263492
MVSPHTPVKPSAEESAGILSRVFIHWPGALVATTRSRSLELSDSLVPPSYDHLDRVGPEFDRAWARHHAEKDGLRRSLYETYKRRFWWAALIFLAYEACAVAGPLFIREMVSWFEGDARGLVGQGLLIAAALAGFHLIDSVAHKHQWSETWKTTHSITALLRTRVLAKYLRMDKSARLGHPTGEVITLASSDALRVGKVSFIHMAWAVPLGVAGSCAILLFLLGWAGLVGIALLIGGMLLSNRTNDRVYELVPEIREVNGRRIGLVSEFVAAIRTLRSHGWEDMAETAVGRERAVLNQLLVRRQRRLATLYLVNAAAPVLMVTATLIVYAALGNTLRAADVFAAIAVLTVLRSQLPELVRYLDMRNDWRVAFSKMTTFLTEPDRRQAVDADPALPGTVEMTGASVAWPSTGDAEPAPVLTGVDLRIEPGELVCVLGRVGSGKSALLNALAGMMRTTAGQVRVAGSVVYLPQQAWIMQGTVAENVRCYSPDDPQRYEAVLRATALTGDLAAMPARDGTLIGERGATLSGGQRQRVALARAAYENADVYLADDPTSAVDDAVATTIMDDLFGTVLAGRTRVVATHRLDFARRADRVIVVDDGRIVAVGSFEQAALSMPELLPELAAEPEAEPVTGTMPEALVQVLQAQEEEIEPIRSGKVLTTTYRRYLRVLTPGILAVVLVGLAVLGQGAVGGSSFWLGFWTERAGQDTLLYASVFAAIGLAGLALDRGLFSFTFSRGVRAGTQLHDGMLRSVLRAPLSFFDRTPSGRITTRFSADMETIDLELPESTIDTLTIFVGLVVPWVLLAVVNPWALVLVLPVFALYLRWQGRTRSSTVEASRLAKQAAEPVLALIGEVVEGVTSIEGRPARMRGFEREFAERARLAHSANYTVNSLSRHFNLRLDILGVFVLFGYAVLLVVNGNIGAGFAGAGLSFAYMLIETLAMSLMTVQAMDLSLASFERVHDYTRLPAEPAGGQSAPAGWPGTGDIRFENVTMRYAEGAPPALDGVTFHAPPGRTIGIAGRTGSGKSSLFATLLRFVEVEGGRIVVDGVDVSTLKLRDLRAAIEVIPQDPVLLPGTVRENIDPFGKFPADQVAAVLAKVGLEAKIASLPDGLEQPLSAGGMQLSAGERQLLCMARALLNGSRIVLVDEATSSLDAETDARIQQVLRTELAGATVLVIAHRRETLTGADLVVRLDSGKVAEVVARDRDDKAELIELGGPVS